MREPTPRTELFGLMAEFGDPQQLVESVKRARAKGFQRLDAYSPFPIEEMTEVLGVRDLRVAWLTLAGGIIGAAIGIGMQVYAELDFPIDIGGRPLVATPATLLITFELTVLFAVLFSIGGMLALNHLPRLNHPLFASERFGFGGPDRFFLVIFGDDPHFDRDGTRTFLEQLGPLHVEPVPHAEEPE